MYDKLAPKAMGYLLKCTGNKDKAEELLVSVFEKTWEEIQTVDEDHEKKLIKNLLMVSRPVRNPSTTLIPETQLP